MHLYDLSWPTELLLDLPLDIQGTIRITPSNFIEPGPGEVGWKDRCRHASNALRFELNSPWKSKVEFQKRINKAHREEDEGHPGTASSSDHWYFIPNARNKGSIQSDIWEGSAAALADSQYMAVYPIVE